MYDPSTLERIRLVRQLQNCGLTIGDIKEVIFLRDADRPVASKRLTEILRQGLEFLEERIAGMESCRSLLIDLLREVAAARSAGYNVLEDLRDVPLAPAFRFGQRGKEP